MRRPDRLGTSFNGATLIQAWKQPRTQCHSVWDSRFNGATLIQAWKQLHCTVCQIGTAASMEPRSFKRGNRCLMRSLRPDSTESLQWSHAHSSVETSSDVSDLANQLLRFNGATLIQAWKPDVANSGFDSAGLPLQWSHAHSSVETMSSRSLALQRPGFTRDASIGATLIQAWKQDRYRGAATNVNTKLQWSHAHSSVETRTMCPDDCAACAIASMEPRSFKRGNCRARTVAMRSAQASMEPRSFKRGNHWQHVVRARSESTSFNGATLIQAWKQCSLDHLECDL